MEEKKQNIEDEKKSPKKGFSNPLKGLVSGELFSKGVVISNLPFLLFVTFLMVGYIGYGYYVDNTVRRISKEEKVGDELYSELQSLMELYDQESLRSRVAQEIGRNGLFETKDPPRVVNVNKGFYIEDGK